MLLCNVSVIRVHEKTELTDTISLLWVKISFPNCFIHNYLRTINLSHLAIMPVPHFTSILINGEMLIYITCSCFQLTPESCKSNCSFAQFCYDAAPFESE